jgi:hypothetical protein
MPEPESRLKANNPDRDNVTLTNLTGEQLIVEVKQSLTTLHQLARRAQAEMRQTLLPVLREIRRRFELGEKVGGHKGWEDFLAAQGILPATVRKWEQRARLASPSARAAHVLPEIDEEEYERLHKHEEEKESREWCQSYWEYQGSPDKLRLVGVGSREEERSDAIESMTALHPRPVAEKVYDAIRKFADELAAQRYAPEGKYWSRAACILGSDMEELNRITNQVLVDAYMSYYRSASWQSVATSGKEAA